MRFASLILLAAIGCPQPTPQPPVVVVPPPTNTIADQLIKIHNDNRSEPLTENYKLTTAAQKHADWMAKNQRMSHTGEGRSKPGSRIKAAGYSWSTYGENVAYGQSTPAEVMRVWLNSPGHRRNIKSTAYNEIGIGRAVSSNDRIYWCVTFGSQGFGADDWDETWAMPEFTSEEL